MIKKLLLIIAFIPSVLLAQHTISGEFSPAEKFNFAILYKITPQTSIYVANAKIEDSGKFQFELDSTITKGVYRIVYALPQEEFNFDIIYNAQEDIQLNFNLDEGVTYLKSEENKLFDSYIKSLSTVSDQISKYYNSNKQSKPEFKTLFKTLQNTQSEFLKASEDKMVQHFITASQPYIPLEYEDAKTYALNVKKHYFDHIDFSNETLQNSNFLIESSLNYLLSFVDEANPNQSYTENIDTIVKAIGNHPTIKKVLLKIYWNQFIEGDNQTVANYIGKTYLLPILDTTKDRKFIENVTVSINTAIGEKAPNFYLDLYEDAQKTKRLTLQNLDESENYLLFFWSSTCSHCLKEIPKLKAYTQTIDNTTLKVVAIGLEDEPYRWKDMTRNYPNFIHVYGEGKWDNSIGNAYGVTSTPSYFILDADKNILAKPNDFEAFKTYVDKHIVAPEVTKE